MQCTGCQTPMLGQVVQFGDQTVHCYSCGDCRRLWVEGSEAVELDAAYNAALAHGASDFTCYRCRGRFLDTLTGTETALRLYQCRECNGMHVVMDHDFTAIGDPSRPLDQFVTAMELIYQRQRRIKKSTQLPKRFRIDQARETDLACPACATALTHYRVQEGESRSFSEFEICDHCFGIWLDKEDLVNPHREAQALAVDFQSIVPSNRTCPKCRDTKLIAMRFKGLATVIDCCSACFGTWLDGGELNEFCDHLGRHGQDVIDSLIDNAVFRQPALCKVLKRFSKTLHNLDSQLQEQERNVEQARDIQVRLLFNNQSPNAVTVKTFADYGVAISWHPAAGVGGDYFDLIPFSRNERDFLGVCIADVSGKGLPASLLMANLQALLRSFAPTEPSPAALCTQLNRVLHTNTAANRFITLFYGVLDLETGAMRYTNAGHNAPLLMRNGKLDMLNTGGTVLGLFPQWEYTERELVLAPGERVLFFTDGVTEAESPAGEEFGDDRLNSRFTALANESIEAVVMQLGRAVKEFNMGSYNDDTTVLLLEKNALE